MHNDKIESLIRTFANEIRAAAQEETQATIADAIAKGFNFRKPTAPARISGGNGKRSAEQLAGLKESILSTIKAHPGERVETLAKIMHVSTAEMALPVRQLVEEKKLVSKGEARGKKYWVK